MPSGLLILMANVAINWSVTNNKKKDQNGKNRSE